MLEIIIPLILLFGIALIKRIPVIGGDIRAALIIAAISSAIISGLGFVETILAFVDGIDRLAWVIMLSIFGSLYAQSQEKLGTIDTTINSLRAIFGNSPKGLIAAIFITLILAGSLLGDAIACATVIGFLIINSLHELKLKPEQIGMIILIGASIGSIMPPITQAIFLSASLIGTDPDPVIKIAYITVTIGGILAIVESFRFVRGKKMPAELIPDKTVWQILKERWKTLIPLFILVIIIIANTAFSYNIFAEWVVFSSITNFLSTIPILKGMTFQVVMAIILTFIISFIFPAVRSQTKDVFVKGIKNVNKTVQIQLCAGIMVGVFYASGLIDQVALMAEGLTESAVKFGGALAIIVIGMLTGSQTTAQTVIVTFLGPILENLSVDPTMIALGASHIAGAGQNLPPVGLTAFVVCGLIGGILNKKVDPIKVMILAIPNSLYFIIVGLIAWFI